MNISFQFFFQNFCLMFPICNKKDFENFLILSMIVSFALTLLSRGSSSWIIPKNKILFKLLQRCRRYVIEPVFSRIFQRFPTYLLSKRTKNDFLTTKGRDDFDSRWLRLWESVKYLLFPLVYEWNASFPSNISSNMRRTLLGYWKMERCNLTMPYATSLIHKDAFEKTVQW